MTVLDFGCGTGFVGMQIGNTLKSGDRLICADVSSVMLDITRRNLVNLACGIECMQLTDETLPLPQESCDVVTVNAALHHVPDLRKLLGEMGRVLRPGGRLLICHEPNKAYYQGGVPRFTSKVVGVIFSPRQAIGGILRRLGIIDAARSVLRRFSQRDVIYDRTLAEVNRVLMAEGSIKSPLTQDQLTALVDVHSPTAGGFRPGRGIDLPDLAREVLPGCTMEYFETHNHLGDHLSSRNGATRWINDRLARRYPDRGATLMAVLRKAPLP